jgi:hypothetical protein
MGAKVRLESTTAEFRRPDNANRKIQFRRVKSCVEPYGSRFEARGSSWAGRMGFLSGAAIFGADLDSRVLGRFIWLRCSASSANRVHVRAMSIRISLTLGLGECSANTRHSAARSLHFSAVSMATPKREFPIKRPKRKPRRDRVGTSGAYCLVDRGLGASTKLAHQPNGRLTVPNFLNVESYFYENFYSSGP